MGKREKEHRKKVQKRNERIKQVKTSFQNEMKKMFEARMEELKLQEEQGLNEIVEVEQINNNNQ
jgi:hypothetical protein